MPRKQQHAPNPHHHGLGSRVQSALGRLAPKSWSSSSQQQQHQQPPPAAATGTGLELSARSATSTDADSATAASPFEVPSNNRPATAISHISSTGSLGAATNDDGKSIASGTSSQHTRPPIAFLGSSTAAHAGGGGLGDDLCSVATQAGSAAHSFSSLQSMMTTHGGDASCDGGPLIATAPAPPPPAGSSDRALGGLSTSPTAAGSSTLSLLSTGYQRGSDAGGDATSVSTLPLISETGVDERLLDIQTLTEEQDVEQQSSSSRRAGGGGSGVAGDGASSEGGPEPSSDSLMLQPPKGGRISSSHGSYTSLASATSEPAVGGTSTGAAAATATAVRMPSPGHRPGHGQRSSSRHSFQQQLQQQLQQQQLQDLEESQEEGMGGSISTGLPVPFSTRRRPDNDDMCSYAAQAGSSVHSLSSVMSHLEGTTTTQSGRPHWSSDGNANLGSSKSFSSLLQQQASLQSQQSSQHQVQGGQSRSQRSSAEPRSPPAHGGPASASAAATPATDLSIGCSSPAGSQAGVDDVDVGDAGGGEGMHRDFQHGGDASPPATAAGGLVRKNSLKGALRAVTRWGSGISQRLQRCGSIGRSDNTRGQIASV